eukprot:symbB.v1.2.030346.t1/scaffold3411.1/size57358/3
MALSTPDIPEPPKFGSLQFDKAFVRPTRQEGWHPPSDSDEDPEEVRRRHEPDEDGKFWDRASVTPQGSFVFLSFTLTFY